ncbi:MAG: hypothetical protein A2W99_03455 [Bacteroidetes bacterium GWF2_33_16]|nr:MAG: hypothetical protein A2X00_11615 [Bacteroidetes bacterium GWE2_32_14]OFY08242.1 MAG: hypothetical protein A2W99_03455 [Bacteroidetes bacterium GWF2_33_16]
MKTFGFIGGGRITRICLQAFKNNGISLEKVVVSDIDQEVLDDLKHRFPDITITKDNLQVVLNNEIIFISLHPPVLIESLTKIKIGLSNKTTIISLAPKLTIEKISIALDGFTNIARMNPSASALVNKGINPICFPKEIQSDLKNEIIELIKSLGSCPEVDESKIEAYAVISAMGHTYYFFQLQKLKELAIDFGMSEQEAQVTITDMLLGTLETLFNAGLSYKEVSDLVPVKPLGEVEEIIIGYYEKYLKTIFNKIKP